MRYLKKGLEDKDRIIIGTSSSVVQNRLIDYKNVKNNRARNISVHEQFNLEILGNKNSWGE